MIQTEAQANLEIRQQQRKVKNDLELAFKKLRSQKRKVVDARHSVNHAIRDMREVRHLESVSAVVDDFSERKELRLSQILKQLDDEICSINGFIMDH